MPRASSRRSARSAIANDTAALLATLPPEQRLALAYAPAAARAPWLALLALDARLAGIVRSSREPLLGQLRLAWWRDQLSTPAAARPAGEPVLALLGQWGGAAAGLTALVDGWEALLGEPPLAAPALERFAAGRAEAIAALAGQLGTDEPCKRAARLWALADLAARLSHPAERAAAMELASTEDRAGPRLPRALRPLTVLHALAARGRSGEGLLAGPGSLALALRVGLFGR